MTTEYRRALEDAKLIVSAEKDRFIRDTTVVPLDMIRAIQAQLDDAIKESPADEWLPIETAPRDGTHILLVGDEDNPSTVVIGWQHAEDEVTPKCFDCSYGNWWPTHWMPLPPPPQPSRTEKSEGEE